MSLEDRSRRPYRLRPATYDYSLVKLVRKLRTDYPSYSSKKLAVILLRDYAIAFSHATIGRIILKYKLYFKAAVTQYFARSHTPKDRPHVENVIGKLQLECLDEDRSAMSLDERKHQVDTWANDYHSYRPHQALNYQTPAEFCATMGITIRRAEVSTV